MNQDAFEWRSLTLALGFLAIHLFVKDGSMAWKCLDHAAMQQSFPKVAL